MAERSAVDHSREPLSGLVERVTFHSPETGFCVLRVKVRGHRDLVTVLGSAAEVHAGDVYHIAPGHDGWVIGKEPLVVVEFQGAHTYAKQQA